MSISWNIFFWISVIAVVAIISWVIVQVVNRNAQTREYIADSNNGGHYKELAERGDDTNAELLEKLSTVNRRLAAIERTLTDIP